MSTQAFEGAYLLPLFHAIQQARGEHAYRQLPAPTPASSLTADDAPRRSPLAQPFSPGFAASRRRARLIEPSSFST